MDVKKYAEFIKMLKEVGLDECPTKDSGKGGDTLG